MLFQILDLLIIFLRQAIACGIRDIYHGSTRLDNSFNHLSQIFIIGTTCILAVELHIVDITLGILRGCNCLFQNLLAGRIELKLNMLVTSTNTCMDTLVLGIFQSLEGHIYVMFHRTGQRTYYGPCHCL